jgi:hypothetical protein
MNWEETSTKAKMIGAAVEYPNNQFTQVATASQSKKIANIVMGIARERHFVDSDMQVNSQCVDNAPFVARQSG